MTKKTNKSGRPKAATPKGFRDYSNFEVIKRAELLETISEIYFSYGFDNQDLLELYPDELINTEIIPVGSYKEYKKKITEYYYVEQTKVREVSTNNFSLH